MYVRNSSRRRLECETVAHRQNVEVAHEGKREDRQSFKDVAPRVRRELERLAPRGVVLALSDAVVADLGRIGFVESEQRTKTIDRSARGICTSRTNGSK